MASSGISRRISPLERLVIASGLGFASAIIAGSTALLAKFPFDSSVGLFLVFVVGLVILWLATKPKLNLSSSAMTSLRQSWLPLGLFSSHVLLWIIYFGVYPHFPNSDAIDVVWHSDITSRVLQGSIGGPVAAAGFPAGAHILFAFVSQYLGLDVLSSLRITAAVLESLSVLVACTLFRRLLPSRLAADYASVAFALLIPSGFIYYAKIGAYPNIIGDFFVLTSMLVTVIVMENSTAKSIITAVIIQGVALISHVSTIIFAGLVIVFSLVVWVRYRPKFRDYFVSNLGFFIFPVAALLFASHTVAAQVSYISTFYLDLNNNLLLVLLQWLHNYLFFAGPVNFLLLLAGVIWGLAKLEKRVWTAFLTGWFLLLFVMVFITTSDWRLVLLSMVPGAGLLGLLLSRLQEALERLVGSNVAHFRFGKHLVAGSMLLLVLVLAAQGPTNFVVNQDLAAGQASVQAHIYDSMIWIRTHTPLNSAVLSVGLQREYRYLPFVANRTYRGDFIVDSAGALKLETEFTFSFIVVSGHFGGLNTFYGSNSFKLLYANQEALIFEVVESS